MKEVKVSPELNWSSENSSREQAFQFQLYSFQGHHYEIHVQCSQHTHARPTAELLFSTLPFLEDFQHPWDLGSTSTI